MTDDDKRSPDSFKPRTIKYPIIIIFSYYSLYEWTQSGSKWNRKKEENSICFRSSYGRKYEYIIIIIIIVYDLKVCSGILIFYTANT